MCRIWNIAIYRLVVMSETIHIVPYREILRKKESHDGIWIIVPAPTVVCSQVLLDRDAGALVSVHDSQIEL